MRPRKRLIAGGVIRACECGCGQYPGLYTKTRRERGSVKGTPRKYCWDHGWVLSSGAGRFKLKSEIPYAERDMGHETACWVWLRGCNDRGYGSTFVDGKRKYAHRYYYETRRGPIPDGFDLDHLCRVPACVNPWHLEAVTHAENVRRGSHVKLTHGQVAELRRLSATDNLSHVALGEIFGVHSSHVCRIVNGKMWKEAG